MSNIVLLEIEEDIRLAAQIVAKNRGIVLKVYADYADYKKIYQKMIKYAHQIWQKVNSIIFITLKSRIRLISY